jgi:heat-inducible transcriptional repressor
MKNNLYLELTDRTKQIFKTVVESYLETGSPSGSETVLKRAGLDISSASVRNILSNLQKEGLLFSPHTSAGRIPTDKGMRFFVDGLLEFGRISKSEKENIEQLSSSKSKSYQEVLDEASRAISGLSNYAGIVIAPKYQKNLKHLEFIRLNQSQIMSILAYENGEIENRIIDDAGKYTNSELQQTSNYLSEKFKNKNINQIKKIIQDDVLSSRSNLEDISSKLIKKGIVEIDPKLIILIFFYMDNLNSWKMK